MSKIALEGNASGTGTFTVAAPNSSSNFTLTLPTNTGTIITQNSTPAFASTIGVGGATAAASGAGITFPASASASSDANTLDDYEEVTWTPTFTANVPGNLNIVYATNGRQGYYTKVGRLVTLHFLISMSTFTHTTASSFSKITGLPFASATNTGMEYSSIAMSEFGGITKANYSSFGWYIASNSSEAIGNASGSGQAYDFINIGDLPSGSTKLLVGTISYFTAS